MVRQTVLVQHTPLWNARATTVMEAYRNRSMVRGDRRPSTAEGACGCQRHLQMSSSCGMHPDDSSHNCFGESYHGRGTSSSSSSTTTAACYDHSAATSPGGAKTGAEQDGCECNTARLFESLDVNDMSGHLWILGHLGTTDDERASLHQFLHGQQQWAAPEPAPRPVEQENLAHPYKRRCVGPNGDSMPVDKTSYDQESREFARWMWNAWDYTMSPYQVK
ncbi:hypothetical protein Purlil1_2147 [Purpureocillium lilacinum]|uniref:Uncharacterized protein n=1 Tax=Purpureocillium lilacinum TaxID=33203 RepID=A0ABR0CDN1_PURLI|nr:hypothetical protein Purlil1_2147 [Purpureocillium lilacinum]GJN75691.1 hypothetical protein PLICBS_009797 [Purpureocillium lilacinum]